MGLIHRVADLPAVWQELRWLFRARMTGSFEWVCPKCGYYTRSRLSRTTWQVLCGNETCRCTYGIGFTLYLLPVGTQQRPPDMVIPTAEPNGMRDAFPQGEVSIWRSGQVIHRIDTQQPQQYEGSTPATPETLLPYPEAKYRR